MTHFPRARHVAFCVAALLVVSATARAGVLVSVSFTDAGFFGEDGRSSKEDGEALGVTPLPVPSFANYHAGLSTGLDFKDAEVRNFFVFDWTEILAPFGGVIPGPISAAKLKLYNPGAGTDGADGFSSPDASETYVLSDTGSKTPAEVMDHYDHPASVGPFAGTDESGDAIAVYSELAAGPVFGMVDISGADNGALVEIAFDLAGLDFLNLKLGEFDLFGTDLFALGGKITTIGGLPGDPEEPDELAFGFTHPNGFGSPDTSALPPMLELTFETGSTPAVPEPSSLVLWSLGGLALVGVGWRRRKRTR